MTPRNRALWVYVAVIAVLLILLARQQVEGAPQPTPEPAVDTQDIMGAQSLQMVAQEAEIASLQQELHDVELSSRSVGLLTLQPGPWTRGWVATFYTGTAGINGSGSGITKSGNPVASDWTCAADTRLLPLGTVIEVEFADGTQEIMQCTDTGGAIHGRRLDIFVPNDAQAMKLGRQRVRVRILERGR